ncbi:hypothetical protein X943_000732 [Babesia divergens]|uniref:Symplekin C-terminal domain-containing protein n=1 Tax=Babesia divergens TaxID=32595 RepID=A0AAD9GH47_BABDI|nr:hypothetical protein X943_000732 [Babesia divergens]
MSQEAEILGLLQRGNREAFEVRLQQFRRLQISQSKAGKAKLCRLINHVVNVDGQYATVLIEDVSNMLNDADTAVRNEALAAFAKSAHLFMFHIILARAVYPNSEVTKDAMADLECALSLVQHAAAGVDASDCRGANGAASVTELVHAGSRGAVASAMRVIMMKLAFLAQLGVEPSMVGTPSSVRKPSEETMEPPTSDTNVTAETSSETVKQGKQLNRKSTFNLDKWYSIIKSDTELLTQLSNWSYTATSLLAGCILAAIKSNKPSALTRSMLAAEVASTLVTYYAKQYFNELMKPLIATHTHMFKSSGAYEKMILRVFTSDAARDFHTKLVAMLNEAGYHCNLTEMYKRAHITAAENRCYVYGGEGEVGENDAVNLVSMLMGIEDNDELFKLATKSAGERASDDVLSGIKAAQVFVCDSSVIKGMDNADGVFDCSNAELRLAPAGIPSEGPALQLDPKWNPKYVAPSNVVELQPVSCDAIREHHQLYSQLVATQMMDTAVSYAWHLRGTVIKGNGPNRFAKFNRVLFNKLFLSGVIPKVTQLRLFAELMDHLAQMALIDPQGSSLPGCSQVGTEIPQQSSMLAPALEDSRNVGVAELLTQVATQRQSAALETLLGYVNDILMTKACLELARGIVDGRRDECLKTLIGSAPSAEGEKMATDGANSDNEEGSEERVSYGQLVDIALEKLYKPHILEVVEVRDAYVLQMCRFILNLPFIPITIVSQISYWLTNKSSRRLAFSLISNILKKSQCPELKEQIFVLFLRTLVAEDVEVKSLFLRLISSPKGLYHANSDGRHYSIGSHEAVFDAMLDWIRGGGGCAKCKIAPYLTKEIIRDCNSMVNRPLWQWPGGLIKAMDDAAKGQTTKPKKSARDCMESVDWTLLSSVWLEEAFALLARPHAINVHPFLATIIQTVTQDGTITGLFEPIVIAAGKNGALVPFICEIAESLDEEMLLQARRSCCLHIDEIVHVLRYKPEENAFLVQLLSDVRTMWLDPKHHLLEVWNKEASPAKKLVEVALGHLESCEAYIMQLIPFMGVEQLERVVTHMFAHGSEDNLKRVLALMLEVPPTFKREQKELNLALPQHFMYQCYSIKPYKELLRRQTGILDHCVECCVLGQMSVESALSACTLIVESTEDVSFVFGRVLCQLVQRVPQTRSVVVQSILPTLIQRGAWSDKMLWRGVVISITTLWPGHKEQLCRLLLLLPQEQGEATIKTLQSQHNVIAFMESTLPQLDHTVHIPDYIKVMLSL